METPSWHDDEHGEDGYIFIPANEQIDVLDFFPRLTSVQLGGASLDFVMK